MKSINGIVASKILELSYWLNELSPKRRVSINAKSLRVINSLLISEILFRIGALKKIPKNYESYSYREINTSFHKLQLFVK